MPKVSEQYRDTRRTHILNAASRCFSRFGYHASSMKLICEEADMSPGAVYNYFTGKEDILTALIEWGRRERRRMLESGTGPPLADLLDGMEASGVEAARLDVGMWAAGLKDDAVAARIREVFDDTSALLDAENSLDGRLLLSLLIGLEVQWSMDDTFNSREYLASCRILIDQMRKTKS